MLPLGEPEIASPCVVTTRPPRGTGVTGFSKTCSSRGGVGSARFVTSTLLTLILLPGTVLSDEVGWWAQPGELLLHKWDGCHTL